VFRDLFGASKAKSDKAAQNTNTSIAASPHQCTETVLGTNTHFEGDLNCRGNVRIEGTFIGNITTEGGITVSADAEIEGNLIGDAVTVGGLVTGDVIARRISILRAGRIFGDLALEQLATEEGAFIQGVITMEEKLDIATEIEYLLAEKIDGVLEPIAEPEPVKSVPPPFPTKPQPRNTPRSR
jgi:cytoskeletal protein CcmA (bactofilin family)